MSLEESIQALTAAVIANTAAMGTAPKAPKAKKDSTESTQPVAGNATPAATAPAAGQQAQSPAASTSQPTVAANPQLLNQTTETVISLANEYSRERAVGILNRRRGSVKCSQLTPEELPGVLAEAQAAIAELKAAKEAATANASLV